MSGRGDIRMYVEHLFEGRTLDTETIELKEEIYGNLVARFDDYVAQGMSEDEAYRRTCEAVTSVEDVMGAAGEKGTGVADPTRVMPSPAPEPTPAAGAPVPPGADAPGTAAPRRWPVGKIVAVVAGVAVVGIAFLVAWGVLDGSRAEDAYRGQTSQTVQQVDDSTSYLVYEDTSQTTGGTPTGGTAQGSTDDLSDQIYAVSPETLAGYTTLSAASPDPDALTALAQTLPLSAYFTGTGTRGGSDTIQLTYNYQSDEERDRIAVDDDYVDRALVFNAAALMCVTSDLNALTIQEIELDDHREADYHVFERATMEEILGVKLDASQLTEESWASLRDQLMEKRVWDRIWDRADRD